jgi:hypothetical protein
MAALFSEAGVLDILEYMDRGRSSMTLDVSTHLMAGAEG